MKYFIFTILLLFAVIVFISHLVETKTEVRMELINTHQINDTLYGLSEEKLLIKIPMEMIDTIKGDYNSYKATLIVKDNVYILIYGGV